MVDPQRKAKIQLVSALTQAMGHCAGVSRGHLDEKESLFDPKDSADQFFYILSGHVRIFVLSEGGRERTLRIQGPLDLVGEDAFYLYGEYGYFAEAYEGPIEFFQVNRSGYQKLVRQWPELYEELLVSLAGAVRDLTQTIEMQTFQDLRGRVQMALIETAYRYGKVVPGGVVIDINLTHETIASMVGATRTRVSVCLSELQHEGFYHVENQHIVLSSWAAGLDLAP